MIHNTDISRRYAVVLVVLTLVLLGAACAVGAVISPQPVSACWSTAEYTCPIGANR